MFHSSFRLFQQQIFQDSARPRVDWSSDYEILKTYEFCAEVDVTANDLQNYDFLMYPYKPI